MTILVVEDDKKVANFIKRSLEGDEYKVDVVHNGEECLGLVLERSYGLIILDLMLTKKDGLTLLRDLREKKNYTPVMILSGKDSIEDIVAGLDAGADDYLSKPFALVELLARVKALQRRTEHERGAKICFSDLCLDPVTHQVWQKEKELDLTAKEYELLEYFMRNQNQVLTRNMIADEIWAGGFDKFTNIIDVYVNYLRRKLHHGDTKTHIHTVRGVGYMLKEVA
jgi:DNA-binding response OmpR family regulator